MIVRQFAPGPALADVVRVFEIIETRDQAAIRTLLPDTGIVIGFRYAGAATLFEGAVPRTLPDAVVTGMRTAARRMHTSARAGIVVAKCQPAGAASILSAPLHHVFAAVCALDQFVDARIVARTLAAMTAAAGDAERIAIVEQFLAARRLAVAADPLVDAALRAIDEARGTLRVGQLADDLGVSRDTLEKRFRRRVGASPKQFASIVRLRQAVALSGARAPLTRVAADAGYYDQSHFNRAFRAVTGAAPRHVLGADSLC